MYNYYFFLIILGVLSVIIALNKQNILKDISIENDIFLTSLFVAIIFGLFKLIKKENIIPKIKSEDTKLRLCGQIIFVSVALYLGSLIIKNENIIIFKSMSKALSLIILFIFSVCFLKLKINLYMVIGVLFVLMGAYLLDQR